MIDARAVLLLARRELRETTRRRSLWAYTAAFLALAIALSLAGTRAAGYSGLGGFGRTSASLVNALLLFVPLLALHAGSAAMLVDRERGSLAYLLAQPVTRTDLFLGKALGAFAALLLSLGLAFAVLATGLLLAGATGIALLATLLLQALLYAAACLALGLMIGSLANTQSTATGLAITLWLGLVLLGDAAFLLSTLALDPSPGALLGILLANPAQSFRVGAMRSLQGDLADLGPLGAYADHELGALAGLVAALALAAWALAATFVAYTATLRRRAA